MQPYHTHINTELLECVYLVSAMFLEIPYMAEKEFDHRRYVYVGKPKVILLVLVLMLPLIWGNHKKGPECENKN